MSKFVGTYTYQKGENLDAYFKALDFNFIIRKVLTSNSPTLKITIEGDQWTINFITSLQTITYNFKLGEEYDEEIPGHKLKNIATLDGSTLTTVGKEGDKILITRTYALVEDECVMTMKHEPSGAVAKRIFKRENQ